MIVPDLPNFEASPAALLEVVIKALHPRRDAQLLYVQGLLHAAEHLLLEARAGDVKEKIWKILVIYGYIVYIYIQ